MHYKFPKLEGYIALLNLEGRLAIWHSKVQEGKCIGIIFLQKENYDFKSALYAPELWGKNSIRDINNVWWVVAHAGVFYIFENSLKNFHFHPYIGNKPTGQERKGKRFRSWTVGTGRR